MRQKRKGDYLLQVGYPPILDSCKSRHSFDYAGEGGHMYTSIPQMGDTCGLSMKGKRPNLIVMNLEIPEDPVERENFRKWFVEGVLPLL